MRFVCSALREPLQYSFHRGICVIERWVDPSAMPRAAIPQARVSLAEIFRSWPVNLRVIARVITTCVDRKRSVTVGQYFDLYLIELPVLIVSEVLSDRSMLIAFLSVNPAQLEIAHRQYSALNACSLLFRVTGEVETIH